MNFHHLEAFISVYETRSFAKTAQLLFISQPAVSQQIQSLEKEIGQPLFTRNHHTVTPTDAGVTFYPYACRLISIQEEAMQALSPESPDFWLHFVAGDTHDPIQQAMLRYYIDKPDARIELLEPVPIKGLISASSLMPHHLYLIRQKWLGDEKIHFYKLGYAQYSILLSPEDPLCFETEVHFSDLENRSFLAIRQSRIPGPFMVEMTRLMRKDEERYIICQNNMEALARLLSDKGKSVFILPWFVQVAGENRFIRKTLVSDASSDPIGLAFIGQPTMAMTRFMQEASGCYRDIK